jgi:hypothetical protein
MTHTIISIHSIQLDDDDHGANDWIVTALVDNMRLLRSAVLHPAELAEPEEWGPGLCHAVLSLEDDAQSPLANGTEYEQIQYLQDMDLEWELDEEVGLTD